MEENEIAISELFVSLQGEGRTQGMPTAFIRTYGCNLKCSYCDTKYSWLDGKSHVMTIEKIIEWIEAQYPKYICITGGEPLMQKSIAKLVDAIIEQTDKNVVIETNGTIDIMAFRKLMVCAGDLTRISFVMDYKVPDMMTEQQHHQTIANLGVLTKYDEVKFVIPYSHIEWAVGRIKSYALQNAIISPVLGCCTTKTDIEQFVDEVLTYQQPNIKIQLQLHKQVWGDKRGV